MPPSAIGKIQFTKIGPWKGMNEKVSPDMLPEGVAADLQNVMLDETPGRVVKRWGTTAQAALPSGLPPRDTYAFTKLNGTAYQMVSDGVTLYYTTDPSDASSYVQLKTGLNPDGFMQFETAEDRVWMSNGDDAVMSWDGTTLLVYDRAFTSTTDLTTVDSTHIIHAGLTSSDNYWNGMKLVFIVGANIGVVVTVTAYVESTKTLTFTPGVSGILAADRFMVGVVIPAAGALRFYDGHMFAGRTSDNAAELRYSQISDPQTGNIMTLDNPQSWPAQNELALNVLDQEPVFGITPILRDRIAVYKASGVWRLERDALVTYRLELISRSIGSRFPDTWAEKNGGLYFLGQDKDGFPDIYKTDMVDVVPVDPDGGIEPTLRSLQQPNSVQEREAFSEKSDFDAGQESTGVFTSNAGLAVGGINTQALWQAAVANSGGDALGIPGSLRVLGTYPLFDNFDIPDQGSTAGQIITPKRTWTGINFGGAGGGMSVSSKRLVVTTGAANGTGRTSVFTPGIAGTQTWAFRATFVNNGANETYFYFMMDSIAAQFGTPQGNGYFLGPGSATNIGGVSLYSASNFSQTLVCDCGPNTGDKYWVVTRSPQGTFAVYCGATASSLALVGTGNDTTFSNMSFMICFDSPGGNGGSFVIGPIYTASWIDPTPTVTPAAAVVVSQFDFPVTPDSFGRIFPFADFPGQVAGCGTTTASLTVQLAAASNMAQFIVGSTLYLRSLITGALIANGSGRVIQSVDVTNNRVTLDAGGGLVTTDVMTGVFLQTGDTVTMRTLSSSDPAFITGNDPAGYVAVAIGAYTTSILNPHLRIELTLTPAVAGTDGPVVSALTCGTQWVSPPIHVGPKIAAWRTFLSLLTAPSGVDQVIQIRAATTLTPPGPSDWGAWFAIVNGNNIGTILSDPPPPDNFWAQLKVEQGPSSVGLLPVVQSLVVQWSVGSPKILPIRAVVHKKRYMLVAASATAATNDLILVCDRNDQWTKFRGLSLNALVHYLGNLYGLDAALTTQRLMDIEGQLNDDGAPISSYLIDKERDAELPHLRKDFRYSYLHAGRNPSPWTMVTSYMLTGGTTFVGAAVLQFDGNGSDVRRNFPTATVGKRIQRQYANAVLGENLALLGETAYFSVRPAQP